MAGTAEGDAWMKAMFGMDPARFRSGTTPGVAPGGSIEGESSVLMMLKQFQQASQSAVDGQRELAGMKPFEGLVPIQGKPDLYATEQDGKPVTIPRAIADKVRADLQAQLSMRIQIAWAVCKTVEEVFAGKQAEGVTQKMAAFFVDDDVTDATKAAMNGLVEQARGSLGFATAFLATFKFTDAVTLAAQAEVRNHNAFRCIDAWQGEVERHGGQIVTGLTVVKEVAFEFDKVAAKVVFSPLGGKVAAGVLDAVQATAEVVGEAAAGDEIDWREKCIDLAVKLVIDMAGGGSATEESIKEEVTKVAEKQLAKHISADEVPAIAKAIAETVWSRIESAVGDATASSVKKAI